MYPFFRILQTLNFANEEQIFYEIPLFDLLSLVRLLYYSYIYNMIIEQHKGPSHDQSRYGYQTGYRIAVTQ
jgi:hypothetical protein